MRKKIVLPYAPILVESTRSIGYSFEAALADIIDNSVGKGAKNVDINFDSKSPQYVAVIDDACGMTGTELESAMRYGSRSSLDVRDTQDLGRFGLGLKMASFSQCRKLTVITRKNGIISAAQWDLDYIKETGEWSLLWLDSSEIDKLRFVDVLKSRKSGTIVIWENFDRIACGAVNSRDIENAFGEKISFAMDHISLVFHRFIENKKSPKNITIRFNNSVIQPIDPFLRNHPATQPLKEEKFSINGSEIAVKPYILPYFSKLSAKDKREIGDLNDLRQNQGFYVYRNKRLIVYGTWFRLVKQQELHKLARVRVDIPNTLDDIWGIDIKKSKASLPNIIKDNLANIVNRTVTHSEKVYTFRGRKVSDNDNFQHVWNIVLTRDKREYRVNRDQQLYKQLESSLDDAGQRYLDSFIKTIEDSFPYNDVYSSIAKSPDKVKFAELDFDTVYKIADDMICSIKSFGKSVPEFLKTMDKLDFFIHYPEVIKKIREDYGNGSDR